MKIIKWHRSERHPGRVYPQIKWPPGTDPFTRTEQYYVVVSTGTVMRNRDLQDPDLHANGSPSKRTHSHEEIRDFVEREYRHWSGQQQGAA